MDRSNHHPIRAVLVAAACIAGGIAGVALVLLGALLAVTAAVGVGLARGVLTRRARVPRAARAPARTAELPSPAFEPHLR